VRTCLVAMTLGVVAACGGTGVPVAPVVPVDQRVVLAPGQTLATEAGVSVQFVEVSGDSRCPADALCIQGGDAIVTIRVRETMDAGSTYALHTGDAARAAATHRGVRIELVELQPYPFSSRPFTPDQYRATLRVTR
jgi:hypothetical protein